MIGYNRQSVPFFQLRSVGSQLTPFLFWQVFKKIFPGQMLNQIVLLICFWWQQAALPRPLQTVSVWRPAGFPGHRAADWYRLASWTSLLYLVTCSVFSATGTNKHILLGQQRVENRLLLISHTATLNLPKTWLGQTSLLLGMVGVQALRRLSQEDSGGWSGTGKSSKVCRLSRARKLTPERATQRRWPLSRHRCWG